jgi:hypothetical protein
VLSGRASDSVANWSPRFGLVGFFQCGIVGAYFVARFTAVHWIAFPPLCRSTDAKAPPKPARAGREGNWISVGRNQYSVGNITVVNLRLCSVMMYSRPSGDSGTS